MIRLSIALVLLAIASPAAHGDPLRAAPFASTPGELQALFGKVKHEPDDAIAVALESVHYRFDASGNYVYRFHRIYKVLNSRGADSWDSLTASYAPWYQKVPELRARVITAGGKVAELDPKSITAAPAPGGAPHTYSDYRQVKAPLPAIAPGAIVEEMRVIRTTAPYFAAGDMRWHRVENPVPTAHYRMVIDAPATLPIRTATAGPTKLALKTRRQRGRRIATYRARDVPAYPEIEPYLPSDVARSTFVALSTGRSWARVAASYSAVIDAQIAAGPIPDLIAKVPRFSGKNRDQVVEAALALVNDNVRYTGLELGQAAIVPWTPAETWRRKYGDCKDKATLLIALLRGAGLQAHVALLNAGFGIDIDPKLPGLGGFDHVIVAVGDGATIWIDATSELSRAGDLPRGDQGRWALIASKRTTRPARTPLAPSTANRSLETREIHVSERGPAKVVETTRYTGTYEHSTRYSYRDSKASDLKKRLESYAKSAYGSELSRFSHTDPADLGKPFDLRIEIDECVFVPTEKATATAWVWSSSVLDELPEYLLERDPEQKKRVHPMQLTPLQRTVRYRIHIPPGFRIRSVPDPVKLAIGQLRFSVSYSQSAGLITAISEIDTGSGRFSPAEVDKLRAELPEQYNKSYEIVLEQIGEAEVAAKRIDKALVEFKRLIKLHPTEALHHMQLAEALMAAGLARPALASARRAVGLEPKSAEALSTLAWALQHDAIGRPFMPGWKRSKALAIFRRAIKLHPDEAWLRHNYAALLSRGPRGEAAGGDLAAALTQLREIRKRAKDGEDIAEYAETLVEVLFFADEMAELERVAKDLKPTLLVSGYRVAAAMATGGIAAARRRLKSIGSEAGSRAEIIQAAGGALMRTRRYKLASRLAKENASRSANSAQMRSSLDLLARYPETDKNPYPASDPRSAVIEVLTSFEAGELSKRASAHLTRRGIDADDLERGELISSMGKSRRQFEKLHFDSRMVVDSIVGMLDLSTTALTGGFAVRSKLDIGVRKAPGPSFYVIKSRGRHRVLATSEWPGALGAHVIGLLDRGDVEGAKAWLEEVATSKAPSWLLFFEVYKHVKDSKRRDRLALAAAALAIYDKQLAGLGIKRLRSCPATPAELHTACQRALVVAHQVTESYRRASQLADPLVVADPKNKELINRAMYAAYRAGRTDRVRAHAAALLKMTPDHWSANRLLALLAIEAGDVKKAYKRLADLADKPSAGGAALNLAAWVGLFAGETGAGAVAHANLALSKDGDEDSTLNTLAVLRAARGELSDARSLLLRSIEARNTDEIRDQDWLVHGKIAEGYGYRDEARRAYRKVARPKPWGLPASSYTLARRWLEKLK